MSDCFSSNCSTLFSTEAVFTDVQTIHSYVCSDNNTDGLSSPELLKPVPKKNFKRPFVRPQVSFTIDLSPSWMCSEPEKTTELLDLVYVVKYLGWNSDLQLSLITLEPFVLDAVLLEGQVEITVVKDLMILCQCKCLYRCSRINSKFLLISLCLLFHLFEHFLNMLQEWKNSDCSTSFIFMLCFNELIRNQVTLTDGV